MTQIPQIQQGRMRHNKGHLVGRMRHNERNLCFLVIAGQEGSETG